MLRGISRGGPGRWRFLLGVGRGTNEVEIIIKANKLPVGRHISHASFDQDSAEEDWITRKVLYATMDSREESMDQRGNRDFRWITRKSNG